jgi:hypothetical protein
MKSNRVLAVVVATGVLGGAWLVAQAGLSIPGLPGTSKSKVDPDTFLQQAQAAESLLKTSLWAMSSALLSKEQVAELKAKKDKAEQVTDPKEKDAQLQEVTKSETAALNEAASDAALKSNVDKMDADRKKLLGASAYNYALGVLQEKALSGQSSGLISSMGSDPSMLTKVGKVKDVAASLTNQLSLHASLAGKMPAVFSAVGAQAPKSADEKPMTMTAVSGE